jgi:DNA modification methylase
LPTRENYEKLQAYGREVLGESFLTKNYDFLKTDFDELQKLYEAKKTEFYGARAYFNNTHDIFNNVWHFDRTSAKEREDTGGHATPKPLALCGRAIKSSSREGELVLDFFGGSGSTLIACEQLNRRCNMIELQPNYCDVIIARWEKATGEKAKLIKKGV